MTRIALLIVFVAGFGVAWSWQGARSDARVAALQADVARESGQALAVLAGRYQAAAERGDVIDKESAARTAALEQQLQEAKRDLKAATRGRPCLGGPALRVLEHAPGIRLGAAVPAPAGALHDGPGAAAADPADEGEYATDDQIAAWIATAGAFYERCRGQLRDIRAWDEGER